jgi:NAD(P)-dependent dehydrogenase (short-subunit alcohol dehydrogenase family)
MENGFIYYVGRFGHIKLFNEMDTIIITGAAQGIGFETATKLAGLAQTEQIILPVRSISKGNEAADKIRQKTGHQNIKVIFMDLGSLESIRQFKEDVKKELDGGKIKILVNNAGLQSAGKTKYTKDGIEETFGVNHLGPFYLTLLLLPLMTNDARISFTASGTHDPKQFTGVPPAVYVSAELLAHPEASTEKELTVGQRRYSTSKLCNIMTAYAMQKHLETTNIHVNAFDPGLVPGTGLVRDYPPLMRGIAAVMSNVLLLFHHNVHLAKTSGTNMANLVYATEYQDAKGKYFEGKKAIPSSVDSYKKEFQDDLWGTSLKLTGIKKEDTIAEIFHND